MPDDEAHALVSGVEVVVPLKELIDVDDELNKLARERKVLEQARHAAGARQARQRELPPQCVGGRVQAKLEELKARLARNEESRGEGRQHACPSCRYDSL